MPPAELPDRLMDRFVRRPLKWAWIAIAAVTVVAVFLGALVVWLGEDPVFDSYGMSVWWALQTMTTVGYGDIVPTTSAARVTGGVIMIVGVSFLAVTTAVVTGTVVEAVRKQRHRGDDPVLDELTALRAEVAELAGVVAELRELAQRPPA